MEAPFVVLKLPLGALQFRLPLVERSASLRGARLGDGKRLLDILDALRQFLVSDAERVPVEREDRMVGPQTVMRFAQSLEFALGFEVGDFRSLDLDERLINRTQGLVELGTNGLDISKRELDAVEMRAQTFVAPANRVERARDFQRLRGGVAAAGLIVGSERAQIRDAGRSGGRRFLSGLVANDESSGVVCGLSIVLKQLLPNRTHRPRPLRQKRY